MDGIENSVFGIGGRLMRKNLTVLLLVVAVVGNLIATKYYNNRERNLVEVFRTLCRSVYRDVL